MFPFPKKNIFLVSIIKQAGLQEWENNLWTVFVQNCVNSFLFFHRKLRIKSVFISWSLSEETEYVLCVACVLSYLYLCVCVCFDQALSQIIKLTNKNKTRPSLFALASLQTIIMAQTEAPCSPQRYFRTKDEVFLSSILGCSSGLLTRHVLDVIRLTFSLNKQ